MRTSKAFMTHMLLILMVGLVFFIGIPGSTAASNVILSLDAEKQSVAIGETFNVTVMITIPSPYGVEGIQFRVTWNSTAIRAISIAEELFHSVTPVEEYDNIWRIMLGINNTGRYADYAYTFQDTQRAVDGGYAPITPGIYPVAIITFNGTETGRCQLSFASDPPIVVGDLLGRPIPTTAVGVVVSVGSLPPALTIVLPRDGGYSTIPVNLTVAIDKPLSWIGYSLDNQANVTLASSLDVRLLSSLIQVTDGSHSLVVYANDSAGLMASSNGVNFFADGTPPTINLVVSPSTSEAAAEFVLESYRWVFNFSASGSHGHLVNISSYFWDFGDGTNATGIAVTHEYRQPGTYNMTLEVTDLAGNTATQSKTITIDPVSEPSELPIGLLAVIVIPVVWVPALAFYFIRMRRKTKKV